ncbi:MFS transporter [Novosphingobium sp. 9]|uniref:MFS transporter n=1 Tax=Novosphingobium sp. 9 TaxID=2025349 RepID=UPI0021B5AE7D|nr:MFS transporter [Novosphingobium sp. 9]
MESIAATRQENRLFGLLVGVYLGGGAINSMVNLLVPRLALTLHLNHAEALLVHFAFYSSYLLFAFPVTLRSIPMGYMRSIATGLGIMAGGCLVFALAHASRSFAAVLGSLLVISLGVTFLQISGNAVTTVFRRAGGMAPRYTLLQAFNALGTVLGPLIGARFILSVEGGVMGPTLPFLAGAVLFVVLAVLFMRNAALAPLSPRGDAPTPAPTPALRRLAALAHSPWMSAGVLAIFCYVGAEVTIATLAVEYLMRADIVNAAPVMAGSMVSLYWGAAMLGRFAGAWLVRFAGAARLLASAALGAGGLALLAAGLTGWAGAVALLGIGLFNSVMFPLAYTLALPADEGDVPLASMLLCMACVGGAVIPLSSGIIADYADLRIALLLPALCYGVVLCFALAHLSRIRKIAWP